MPSTPRTHYAIQGERMALCRAPLEHIIPFGRRCTCRQCWARCQRHPQLANRLRLEAVRLERRGRGLGP